MLNLELEKLIPFDMVGSWTPKFGFNNIDTNSFSGGKRALIQKGQVL